MVRFTLALVAATVLLLNAGTAHGVTIPSHTADAAEDGSNDALTTGAAARARADVQIRRVKNLLVTKSGDEDEAYETLEMLQKQLRGQN